MLKSNQRIVRDLLLAAVSAGFVLALSVLLTGCNNSDANGASKDVVQGRPVKVLVVTDASSEDNRTFPGIVKAEREIDLAFRVGGPLVEYDLNIGEQVKKGEILARIDPRDFEIRIKKLSAELKAAEARLADAEKDYARQKNLLKESAASQSQYDKTQMLVETTRAGIDSLKADLAAARNALNDTRLAAPFDGVVNRKFTENHESINPGVPVVSLLDISKVEVVTAVPEDIVIRKSDFVNLYATLDAYSGQKITASLKEIGRQTDSANQSYPLSVVLDPPAMLTVTPGMAATVHIVLRSPEQHSGGVYLPTSAVFAAANGDTCVWCVAHNSHDTERVKVKTGELKNDEILVTSGIKPGDRVVSAGARFLVEGQKIRIMEKSGEAAL